MSEPRISVITPVYNGAQFLSECMDSVLAQTYRNFSFTVVDNCSTDDTPAVVESYARRDSRVTLVRHEEFVDAAANHNRAFRSIDTDCRYVKVVQADDLIFPECIERMVDLAVTNPTVGVISGYRLRYSEVELVGLPFPQSFATGRSILRQSLLGGPYVTGSPTSLLLRADLVRRRDPFYDDAFEHCDTEAAYWAFTQADFALVHGLMTFSRRQPGSRISWSVRVKTFWPENLRMLLKYGPLVLTPQEYRSRVRYELAVYVWFHMKQRIKPSRWRDLEFHRFHRRMTRLLREESGRDQEVVAATAVVRALLARVGEGTRTESP